MYFKNSSRRFSSKWYRATISSNRVPSLYFYVVGFLKGDLYPPIKLKYPICVNIASANVWFSTNRFLSCSKKEICAWNVKNGFAMAMSSGYEKKEFPQDPPWSQAMQVSATRLLDTLHRKMGFVNLINSIYGSMLWYAQISSYIHKLKKSPTDCEAEC